MVTQEEIEIIKETGICDNIPLNWYEHHDGLVVNGEDVIQKSLRALCPVCKTLFVKEYVEPTVEDSTPQVVVLD